MAAEPALSLAPEAPEPWALALRELLCHPARVRLAFQPIVDLRRGAAAGYEALARFAGEPDAAPDSWFAAATRLGLAAELEALTVSRALEARRMLPANCFLSINVSPAALLADPVRHALERAGGLDGLVLELTEAPAGDDAALPAALAPLRAAGASVAVTGAGSGLDGLRHVTALRPEFVKVDGELVAGVDADEGRAALIEMVAVLAGRLDAWLVAEGIEHGPELARVIALDVPLGQGFVLGRPAPEMRRLDEAASDLLSGMRRREGRRGAGSLIEDCPRAPAGAPRGDLAAVFVRDPQARFLVLVGDRGRPEAILDRDGLRAGAPPIPVSLVVDPDDDLREIARRAMRRPPERRFDPIACCDPRGRLLGLLRADRLVEALARLGA